MVDKVIERPTRVETGSDATRPVTYQNRDDILKQKHYITTAIAYLNGPPHVGHAYEFVTADVIARYHRIAGRDTHYQTGSDEHGQKIANTAEAQKKTPLELCEENVAKFKALNQDLGLGQHYYIRTTDSYHEQVCQWLWKRVEEYGDIYMDRYEGWYNVREENFLTERDAAATDYKDPDTGKPYEKRTEESYFFRMSKYHNQVYDLIKNTEFVEPEARRNELLARLERAPLEDLSISRSTLKWGIPVPGSDTHVMYVWFDALTNYLSGVNGHIATDEKSRFWPADLHIIGKDIIWFHSIIWPSMLLAAKLPLPAKVFGHGFIQAADGSKMSKSFGNVIDPMECLRLVGSDTFRYYLCREARYGQDVRFSSESLCLMHNADLCSTLGNLVHRATALCIKGCDSKIPDVPVHDIVDYAELFNKIEAAMGHCELDELAVQGLNVAKAANKYLSDEAPWKIKDDEPKKRAIIRSVLESIYIAAHVLHPLMPIACSTIIARVANGRIMTLRELKNRGNIPPGTPVSTGEVLFTPLETLEIGGAKSEK